MAQNFVACDREHELLLPPSLREWLPEGHLGGLLSTPSRSWIWARFTPSTSRKSSSFALAYWLTIRGVLRAGELDGRGPIMLPLPFARCGGPADDLVRAEGLADERLNHPDVAAQGSIFAAELRRGLRLIA